MVCCLWLIVLTTNPKLQTPNYEPQTTNSDRREQQRLAIRNFPQTQIHRPQLQGDLEVPGFAVFVCGAGCGDGL